MDVVRLVLVGSSVAVMLAACGAEESTPCPDSGCGGASNTDGSSASGSGAVTGGSASTSGGTGNTGPAGNPASTSGSAGLGNPPTGGASALGGATNDNGGMSGSGGATGGGTSNAGSSGNAGSGGGVTVAIDPKAIYVAPEGTANAAGTLAAPTTFVAALGKVSAGGTIYARGGTYTLSATLTLSKDGTSASPIVLRAYPLDTKRPLLNFSSTAEGSSNRGLSLSGDYWQIYGLDVLGAGDNGMYVSGAHNRVEFCSFSECADSGLQLGGGASDNLIVNCDSYFNADSTLENADGFAAKLDVGTGNKFVGCRAWNNLDDGWDGYLRPANDVTTTYERCWAMDNGKLKDGSVGAGDGNGFKTGGSDGKDLKHNAVYTQCIASGNVNDGFDHNSNRGSITILNSAAHANGSNLNFGVDNIAASLTVKNSISLGTNGQLSATTTNILNNSWQNGRSATEADFVSVDRSQLKRPRKSDGSLPDIDYLRLAPSSALRNAGVDVGLPYAGSAPDLGPFESAN